MNYHVITPLNRFENYKKLVAMLTPHKVLWHIILDEDQPFRILAREPWITIRSCYNEQEKFYERCNWAINRWLDTNRLEPEDYYCILNDDDAYEPGFFDKIRQVEADVIVPSMMRGHHTPGDVTPERAHGTDTLVACPENMKVGRIGVEQMIVKGRILRDCRLPLTIAGDGEMLTWIAAHHPVTYVPDANVWFNYFEPGRWDK